MAVGKVALWAEGRGGVVVVVAIVVVVAVVVRYRALRSDAT